MIFLFLPLDIATLLTFVRGCRLQMQAPMAIIPAGWVVAKMKSDKILNILEITCNLQIYLSALRYFETCEANERSYNPHPAGYVKYAMLR